MIEESQRNQNQYIDAYTSCTISVKYDTDVNTELLTFVFGELLEERPGSCGEDVTLLDVAFLHHVHAVDDDAESDQTHARLTSRVTLALYDVATPP